MTIIEFNRYLQMLAKNFEKLTTQTLPRDIGAIAVEHFKENFQNEAFDDEKWIEVQRRIPGTRAYKYASKAQRTRKILTGETGDLGRSIQFEVQPGKVIVFSDLPYAQAHNEGTYNAGRKRNIHIPKRQFIGESNKLNQKIEKHIKDCLNDLF